MVDKEFHNCTSLQHGRIGLHLCRLYCQVLTVDADQHIQTLYASDHDSLPSDIHSTHESKMMGRCSMQESSQQFLMLKCNTLHTGHCGRGKNLMGHYRKNQQSDTQLHTDMLVHPVSQQCRWSIVVALVDINSLILLLFQYGNFQLPFQHTVVVCQKCWDMWFFPTWYKPHHQ